MDSHKFNQAATKTNDYDHNNGRNEIDLTLKLGLPNSDHENQHLDFDQMAPHHANLDIDALYSHEGINHYEMVSEGMDKANVGQVFDSNEVAWPPSNLMGSRSLYDHAHAQYTQSNYNGYGFSPFPGSSSVGSPPLSINYPHNNNIINPNHNLQLGNTASAGRRTAASMRRPRGGTFNDPYKRCTKCNCNTNDTPMWRRGPLGPKTLCNACGIKHRKEEEKRMKVKDKEADKSNSHDSNAETA